MLDAPLDKTGSRGFAKRNRDATQDSNGESDKMLHGDTSTQRIFWILWHSMRWCL